MTERQWFQEQINQARAQRDSLKELLRFARAEKRREDVVADWACRALQQQQLQ